jgi:hypothetical protein
MDRWAWQHLDAWIQIRVTMRANERHSGPHECGYRRKRVSGRSTAVRPGRPNRRVPNPAAPAAQIARRIAQVGQALLGRVLRLVHCDSGLPGSGAPYHARARAGVGPKRRLQTRPEFGRGLTDPASLALRPTTVLPHPPTA